ncbi:hypothetical protein HID58_047023, partial [Brassica napus]
HGKKTHREILRIKRSVSADYSQVCSLITYNQIHFTLLEKMMQKDEMPEDEMTALKRQLMSPMSTTVTSKDGARKLGFVSR